MTDTSPPEPSPAPEPSPDAVEKASSGRGWRVWLSVGILAFIAVVAIAIVVASRGSEEYSSEDQLKFLAACTTQGGEPVRNTCTCIYDQLKVRIPYDRYVEVNSQLVAARQGDTTQGVQLPPDVEVIRADCVNRAGSSSAQPGAFGDQTTIAGAPKYSTPESLDNGPTSEVSTSSTSAGFSRSSTTAAPAAGAGGGGAVASTTTTINRGAGSKSGF